MVARDSESLFSNVRLVTVGQLGAETATIYRKSGFVCGEEKQTRRETSVRLRHFGN